MRSGIATSARPSGPSQVDNCHKIVGCPLHIGLQPSLTLGDCYKDDNCHKIFGCPLHIGRQPSLTLGDCYKEDNCHKIACSPLHIGRQPSLTLGDCYKVVISPKDYRGSALFPVRGRVYCGTICLRDKYCSRTILIRVNVVENIVYIL